MKYDITVRNYKEYEPLQQELATQINQHLEKLLDPLIIEKAKRAYTDKVLAADTIVSSSYRLELPATITISKLAEADKKIFLKYISQVKTLYMAAMRDNMLEKNQAEVTLALVKKEYNTN